MCVDCWKEYDSPTIDTPDVRAVAVLIADLYQEHGTGGGLHVLVDDWNIDILDGYDLSTALERRCLEALRKLSEDERASALALHDGFWKPDQQEVTT